MRKISRYMLLMCLAVTGLITIVTILILNSTVFSPSPLKKLNPTPKEFYNLISPSSYRFILNQPGVCDRKKPFLIFMIPVTLSDTEARNAIRNTWGQNNLIAHVNIVRFFFIGQPAQFSPALQQHLERESEEYGDIIQMDFVDNYHNLTVKTMMMMNWIATYCQSARYAMKIDADIFLNAPFLVDHLRSQGESSWENYITGSVIADGHPKRKRNSKWYISEELYPDTSFPPYVSGAAYVFSTDLAEKISLASRFVRPIPLEDVYVGLCLNVLGVRPVYAIGFLPFRNLFEVRKLKYDRCAFANRIIVNGFKPPQLLRIWHDFQRAGLTC